MGKTLAI